MSLAFSVIGKIVSSLFLMGSTLLLIFIVLSGSIVESPVNKFYWLQADTSDIAGAPEISRWTFWGLCGVSGDNNVNCSYLQPAFPLSPVDDFGTTVNVPRDFVSSRDTYYYLSRFSFCFFLISLVFIGVALIFYVLSWCSYTFSKTVFVTITIGTLLNMAASGCQTAATVLAKNAFKDAGLSAKVGVKLMAFSWTTVAMNIVLFFVTGASFIRKAYKAHQEFVELQKYKDQALGYEMQHQQFQPLSTAGADPAYAQDLEANGASSLHDDRPAPQPQEPHQSGIKFFKIRRTHKSDEESI